MSLIQILSDLHLEAPKSYDLFEIIPIAPCLPLIGDIGCVKDTEYLSFLERQLSKFKTVFLIFGNHEPYHSSWATTRQKLRQFEEEMRVKNSAGDLGLFVLMDQTRFDVSPEITVLGCTLFSNVSSSQTESVSFGLNDFYHIDDWTVEEHNKAYTADLQWLNAQVKSISETEPDRKIIIFSPIIVQQYLRRLSTRRMHRAKSRRVSRPICLASFAGRVEASRCGRLAIRISTAILKIALGNGFSRTKGDIISVNRLGLMQVCVLK